jgi:hypothetical protein
MAGPSAVRSMRAPREKASEWSGAAATIVPVLANRDTRLPTGMIKRGNK